MQNLSDRHSARGKDESGTLRFEVDAGLLFQLGEQLVARRSIALAELIKNAYDADATQVIVRMENVTQPDGVIVVKDNGTGMTFEAVRDHWMRIATDDKIRSPISPVYCRPRTGAKGIGRFAARRLAHKLILDTVAQREDGTKERVVVEFDWKKQFRPGQSLTRIPVTYTRTTVDPKTPTGVTLRLESVRDVWTKRDVNELQRDLLSLTSPFPQATSLPEAKQPGCQSDPGFSIDLQTPEFPEFEGKLEDQFLAAAWGILEGDVDEHGFPHYRLHIRITGEDLNFSPTDERFRDLVGARFRIHFFVYKAPFFKGFAFGVRDAQEIGREQGGVRIYLDGFRVFPYGDPGDDWLQLDEVRAGRTRRLVSPTSTFREMERLVPGRPWLLTPGNNQVFGAVEISRLKHPQIQINVSRERLVENEAFAHLKRFVQIGIYWMTIQYARVKAEEEARERTSGLPDTSELLDELHERVDTLEELTPDSKQELIHILDYARERLKVEREERISELSMLRVLSSTGAAIAIINHQIRGIVDGIRAIYTDLSELAPHIPPEAQQEFQQVVKQTRDWYDILRHQVSLLGSLLGLEARGRRRRLSLREAVQQVAQVFSLYMRDFGIEFSNGVLPYIKTPPIFEAELYSILVHLFTNALKAVRERKTRKIAAEARRDGDELHIFLKDTGVGIAPEMREEVFKPFVTTSKPDPILGVGTGLGLKVVRDIVETYGGTARFIDPDPPWRTCIEIILPYSER